MDIRVQSTIVGEIRFGEDRPSKRRTLDGFLIELPIWIRLRPTPRKRLIPMLSGLRGSLYFHDEVADEAGLEVDSLGVTRLSSVAAPTMKLLPYWRGADRLPPWLRMNAFAGREPRVGV